MVLPIAQPEAPSAPRAGELERLADDLHALGGQARRLSVLGTRDNETTSEIALTLARLLARRGKVVLVDLSPSASFALTSADPDAPGLADLMRGDASFGQIITRDRASPVHLVGGARQGSDRALLQSPRLTLALDALARTYDHVVLDAGTANDLPTSLLASGARAIVAPDSSMTANARSAMADQLKAVGFSHVIMLGAGPGTGPRGRLARQHAAA